MPFPRGSIVEEFASYKLPEGPKLNLGCGPVQPEGWVNIDGSNRAWLAAKLSFLDRFLCRLRILPETEFGPHVMVHDLCKAFPFGSNSVACIYAGQVWEHFEYADAVGVTAECYRVLAPGGVLRVCVPDGALFWRRYLQMYDEAMSKPAEQRDAEALRRHVRMYFDGICTRKLWLGSMKHKHKWQFDEVQLVALFKEQGFCCVSRARDQQSRIPDIPGRERCDQLMVEGVKPRPAGEPRPA